MDRDEVQRMINLSIAQQIKKHEIRVGWISGVIGTVFSLGIIHSIWLIKSSIK